MAFLLLSCVCIGLYRYYSLPDCLYRQLSLQRNVSAGVVEGSHSAQVGWALDGFPIYGPRSVRGIKMLPCTHPSAHPQLCLDNCGGFFGKLKGVDEFLYRYYLPSNYSATQEVACSANVRSLGACQRLDDPCCSGELPEVRNLACLRGCLWDEVDCLESSSPGVTSAYQPRLAVAALGVNLASFATPISLPSTPFPSPTSTPTPIASPTAPNGISFDPGNFLLNVSNKQCMTDSLSVKLVTHNPLTRQLDLRTVKTDGTITLESLPQSRVDAFIQSMAEDREHQM